MIAADDVETNIKQLQEIKTNLVASYKCLYKT